VTVLVYVAVRIEFFRREYGTWGRTVKDYDEHEKPMRPRSTSRRHPQKRANCT
jgi:hypothetical protein